MAIAKDIVKEHRLDEAMQQAPAAVQALAGFSRFYSFSERAPVTGTWGDPRTATADVRLSLDRGPRGSSDQCRDDGRDEREHLGGLCPAVLIRP